MVSTERVAGQLHGQAAALGAASADLLDDPADEVMLEGRVGCGHQGDDGPDRIGECFSRRGHERPA